MPRKFVSIKITEEQRFFATRGFDKLTPREHQILHGIANNLTSKQIARVRGIAPSTVETHKNNIMVKLGVHGAIEIMQVLYVLATE